jgi:hypothetical protein
MEALVSGVWLSRGAVRHLSCQVCAHTTYTPSRRPPAVPLRQWASELEVAGDYCMRNPAGASASKISKLLNSFNKTMREQELAADLSKVLPWIG